MNSTHAMARDMLKDAYLFLIAKKQNQIGYRKQQLIIFE